MPDLDRIIFAAVAVALVGLAWWGLRQPSCADLGGEVEYTGLVPMYDPAMRTIVPKPQYRCVMPDERGEG